MKKIHFFFIIFALLAMCPAYSADYYVATNGNNSNPGTLSSPFATLTHAISSVSPGDYIYMRGGTYSHSSTIVIDRTKNGTSSSPIRVFAYNGESAVLDFSGQSTSSSNRGVVQDAHYWHWKGIIFRNAGDNGMLLSGNNNTIENCIFRGNRDSGLQLSRWSTSYTQISQWPSNNLITGCEAYDNSDPDHEDADGFAAKLTCGNGNRFINCVSHHNIDDGWDLYTKSDTGPIGEVYFERCISHNNGTLTDGSTSGNGDKNGFKLGSSAHNINHTLRRCIAFNNGKHGFADNGNVGSIEFTNCTGYNNVQYNFHTRDGASHIFKNNVTFAGGHTDRIVGNASAPNAHDDTDTTWPYTASSSDFATLTPGSNNDPTSNGFLNLVSGSQFIDAGAASSGITYSGSSPDLGAIEYGGTPPPSGNDYTLSVSVQGQGSVSPNGGSYDEGTNITLTATPASGWSFSNWSGDASGTNSSMAITMNSNKSVTATFTEDATPPPSGGTTVRIEDTDAGTVSYDGSLKSYSAADNGTAINLSNASGQQIVWSYSTSSAGSYTLTLRYTRKSTMNPSVNMIVNGASQTLSFPATASSAFATASLTANLSSGSNTIILETNASNESADIDWIEISGESTSTTQYTVSTAASGNGSVSGGGTYDAGSVISLTATPASGYQFDNWSGSASGTSNPLSVTVDGNKSITANFSQIPANCDPTTLASYLQVNGGAWQATSNVTIDAGDVVTFGPQPTTGGSWSWSGCGTSGTSREQTISPASSCAATVTYTNSCGAQSTVTFNVTVNSGTSEITLQENASGFCTVDGAVESEHSGYTSSGYANTDNASGTGIDYAVNVGASGTYTIEIRYASISDRPGNLQQDGSVVASGISLPSTGAWTTYATTTTTASLTAGTSSIRLEGTTSSGLPNIDYMKISGPGNLSAATCGFTGGTTYTLTTSASPSNGGSISLSPSGGTYDAGTVVTLTATPSSGYSFTSWAGDASGSSASTTITMDGNKSVTALFSDGSNPGANYALVGWATQAGGTTGGSGGVSVTCSTGDCIQNAINDRRDGVMSQPLTVYVNGTITPANTSSDSKINVKDARDISIIGIGTSGVFNGIGIKVYRAGNVIIQNVTVHHVNIGDKDAISIEGPADHIWVDHCELYAQFQGIDQDYYDGLLDAKAEAEYITYSYNYLHDSWKTMLVGSSDSDNFDRKITAHHNYFDNCNSRLPLFRFGNGHFFNNYYSGVVSTGLNSRMGACLRVENNYFKDSHNPIVSAYSSQLGAVDETGSIFDNVTWDLSRSDVSEPLICNANVPYSYSASLNSTADVPSVVITNAGVGKVGNGSRLGNVDQRPTLAEINVYPNPTQRTLTIEIPDFTGQEIIRIVTLTGMEVARITPASQKAELDISNLTSGSYIIQLKTGSYTRLKMFIKQ